MGGALILILAWLGGLVAHIQTMRVAFGNFVLKRGREWPKRWAQRCSTSICRNTKPLQMGPSARTSRKKRQFTIIGQMVNW